MGGRLLAGWPLLAGQRVGGVVGRVMGGVVDEEKWLLRAAAARLAGRLRAVWAGSLAGASRKERGSQDFFCLATNWPAPPRPAPRSQVDSVPVVHGSALFCRGETQSLCTATVGNKGDEQRTETLLEGEGAKRLAVHYSFPAFSIGEVGGRAGGRAGLAGCGAGAADWGQGLGGRAAWV